MKEKPSTAFMYEQCDVPEGMSLAEWRSGKQRPQRRTQVTSGMLAAAATLAPTVLSVRGTRPR
jgi:hypothetical protein